MGGEGGCCNMVVQPGVDGGNFGLRELAGMLNVLMDRGKLDLHSPQKHGKQRVEEPEGDLTPIDFHARFFLGMRSGR